MVTGAPKMSELYVALVEEARGRLVLYIRPTATGFVVLRQAPRAITMGPSTHFRDDAALLLRAWGGDAEAQALIDRRSWTQVDWRDASPTRGAQPVALYQDGGVWAPAVEGETALEPSWVARVYLGPAAATWVPFGVRRSD